MMCLSDEFLPLKCTFSQSQRVLLSFHPFTHRNHIKFHFALFHFQLSLSLRNIVFNLPARSRFDVFLNHYNLFTVLWMFSFETQRFAWIGGKRRWNFDRCCKSLYHSVSRFSCFQLYNLLYNRQLSSRKLERLTLQTFLPQQKSRREKTYHESLKNFSSSKGTKNSIDLIKMLCRKQRGYQKTAADLHSGKRRSKQRPTLVCKQNKIFFTTNSNLTTLQSRDRFICDTHKLSPPNKQSTLVNTKTTR